jgi:hypothetical protein
MLKQFPDYDAIHKASSLAFHKRMDEREAIAKIKGCSVTDVIKSER